VKKQHKAHEEPHTSEAWLIPYADILTLLLALFIILFASSQVDQQKYEQVMQGFISEFTGGSSILDSSSSVLDPGSDLIHMEPGGQLVQEQSDMASMKKMLDEYIDENGLSAQLETNVNGEMLRIIIRDYALFDSGSAAVKADAQKLAVDIAGMLSSYPNYTVEVAGYTDDRPIHSAEFDSNWDLSSVRALHFMKYILLDDQVNEARFRTVGYGEFRPIDTNETEEGRAKNRRVEVTINSK
jgi:chemotaxis protein MotB